MFYKNTSTFINKIFIKSTNQVVLQFFRYIITGGIAAVADISVFTFLTSIHNFYPLFSNTVSFTIGLTINYFLSRQWVFNKKVHRFTQDFLIFLITGVIGLILSNFIIYILLDFGLIYHLNMPFKTSFIQFIAKIFTVCAVFIWNFMSRKYIISKVNNG